MTGDLVIFYQLPYINYPQYAVSEVGFLPHTVDQVRNLCPLSYNDDVAQVSPVRTGKLQQLQGELVQ
jgi:hypothetical protein